MTIASGEFYRSKIEAEGIGFHPIRPNLEPDPEIIRRAMDTRKGGDEGTPITVRRPDSAQAQAFRELGTRVIQRLDAVATLRSLPTIS